MKTTIKIAILAALLFAPLALHAAELYVAPNGDDQAAGNAPDIGDSVYWIPGQRMEKASFPIVPDKMEKVPLNRDVLMWRPAYKATAHHVYFGTDQNAVKNAGAKSSEYNGEFKGESNVFKLPHLTARQTYWWRVDAVMPNCSVVPGALWSFTTTPGK
jgi:hypothetical protein